MREPKHNHSGGSSAKASWTPSRGRQTRTQEASPDTCRVFQSAIHSLESTGHGDGAAALKLAIPSPVKERMVRFDLAETSKGEESLAPLVWRKRRTDNFRIKQYSNQNEAWADYSPNPQQSGKFGWSSKTPTKRTLGRATPTSAWLAEGGRLKHGGRWRPVTNNQM